MSAKKDASPVDAEERRLEAQRSANAALTKRFLSEHKAGQAEKAKRGADRTAELEKQAVQDGRPAQDSKSAKD